MINCAACLRLIQHKAGHRVCYPWSGICQPWLKIGQKLCNYSNNNNNDNNTPPSKSKSKVKGNKTPENIEISQESAGRQLIKDITQIPKQNPLQNPRSSGSSKKRYGYSIFLAGLCSSVLWAIYELGKPEEDPLGRSIEDDYSILPLPQQYIQRMWQALNYYQKMLEEPMPTRLLPDIVQPPYIQPRYTLVLEMKDVLVHPDWTYQTGWRFKKRPGVDHFLRQCSKHFEIIVYTAEQGMTAFPILDALDPHGYVRYRLVRGATQLVDGQHIKNLNRLNRNLRRVIVVDWDRRAVPLHPDNIFAITRWLGNDDDVQLYDLAAFLSLIAEHKMDDVREVLHYYRQFEDPIEQFKENQRKLLELRRQETPETEPICPK